MRQPIARWYQRRRLTDPRYRFLFEPDTCGEAIALDCETTGLDPTRDEIIAVAAIPIRRNRLLTSRRLHLTIRPERAPTAETVKVHHLRPMDVAEGMTMTEALPRILDFIGPRPLVGYYIEFDLRMLNRYVAPALGARLVNPLIDVSRLYYAYRYQRGIPNPGHAYTGACDLRFETIRQDLGLPVLAQHNAHNDALTAGMMYLTLTRRDRRTT
jgi:DNA polymerase-3 subunit epsilon